MITQPKSFFMNVNTFFGINHNHRINMKGLGVLLDFQLNEKCLASYFGMVSALRDKTTLRRGFKKVVRPLEYTSKIML